MNSIIQQQATVIVISFVVCCLPVLNYAQDIPSVAAQQIEQLVSSTDNESEDDSYLMELEQFRKDPVNLNTVDETSLKSIRFLSALQVVQFIAYRRLLGPLTSIYELQAVPCWDIGTIKKLLPFVEVREVVIMKEALVKRFKEGEHSISFRLSLAFQENPGHVDTSITGSPLRVFMRYKYTYKNLLQYGFAGDKDAGESFGRGAQRMGFDFYTLHLFLRKLGVVRELALGDFTVNMGQGLVQWQGMAFGKGTDAAGIKRQSSVLRPYHSAGEYNFNRGAGVTIQKGKLSCTFFLSSRKLDARVSKDTTTNLSVITSVITSGYHRTEKEIATRNILAQQTAGCNISWNNNSWNAGINYITYRFEIPFEIKTQPYNQYAINGKGWSNYSVDYAYTLQQVHFFGEIAADRNRHVAFVNGLVASVDPRVDLSIVHRCIVKEYQAVNGNAFTENTEPTNEKGLFAGITLRPAGRWRIDGYADLFVFAWLKFNSDAPSSGDDYQVQVSYVPDKRTEIVCRYRSENKMINMSDEIGVLKQAGVQTRQNIRMQVHTHLTAAIMIRNRAEAVWFRSENNHDETGFLIYTDVVYKPMTKPYSGILRFQYFETDSYNSRIYAYENDVLYSFSVPAFSGAGCKYYIVLQYDFTKKISCWLKWSHTTYKELSLFESSNQIPVMDWRVQIRYIF
jgi:hypothetical protein